MHAEHWDGRTVCNFNEKDMPNIRKLLTYKWFTHPENDTAWKHKFTPQGGMFGQKRAPPSFFVHIK
jgi:hypothetical protein